MAECIFTIPAEHDALLNESTSGTYVVQNFFETASVSGSVVTAAAERFVSNIANNPFAIVDNFDDGYSLCRGFNALPAEHKQNIFLALSQACTSLHKIASKNNDFDDVLMVQNSVKMMAYLFTMAIENAEDGAALTTATTGHTTKTGKNKGKSGVFDWGARRAAYVDAFAQLIARPLCSLWTSPEPEFVNLFSKTAFKLLENVAVTKDDTDCRAAFTLIGLTVQHFNQGFNVTTSILHLLGHFEHLAQPSAQLVVHLVDKFDGQAVVNELMHEIGRNDPKEFARDTSGTRNIATFLSTLGDLAPGCIIKSAGVSVLLPHLDGESYMIRNGILAMLTSMVCHVITTHDESESGVKMRTQFQAILEDRIHDVSAYVRAKALQMWARMAAVEVTTTEEDGSSTTAFTSAIPRSRLPVLVKLAADRLKDKSSLVRKDAMRLMTVLLTRNPYGAELRLSQWTTDYAVAIETFTAMQQAAGLTVDALQQQQTEREEDAPEEEEEEEDHESATEDTGDDNASSQREIPQELAMQALKVKFFKEATFFAQQMEEVIPCACDLLGSANATDIKESIAFLEACQRYHFESAPAGIRKMLALVWSKEESIKEALVDAYTRLYLSQSNRPETVAQNLVHLTTGCNLGELTSLEELVHVLQKKSMITPSVIKTLWSMFAMRGKDATRDQSVRALIILGMTGRADPSIIERSSGQLISIGFGERGQTDMELVRCTCKALKVLVPTSSKLTKGSKGPPKLFDAQDPLFEKMITAIVPVDATAAPTEEIPDWHSAAEEVVNTIYTMAESPDHLCRLLIARLVAVVFRTGATPTSAQLARLVSVVGHVALQQLVHLERLECELKRRSRLQEDRTVQQKKQAKGSGGGGDEDDIVGGAAAIDSIAEDVAAVAEESLVTGGMSLLSQFAPLVCTICTSPAAYPDTDLRVAAVLALTKFMCASQQFAEDNLQLFFTVMQDAPEASIRANCILGVGDLAFRFANLLEPWTGHMYARLRDGDVKVRKNAVMVLTHLILNDMIKVKGQISEMAVRLEDPDERVASLAHLFFHELSRKGNAIYNMLPDVISQLASPESKLSSEAFKKITSYLFSFITKGVHSISLVEKLCYRFRTTQDVQQWRYFAHCLSLLSYTDKAIKKLQSQVSCFQNSLFDPEIYESFQTIVSKAKKFASADMKNAVAEFEERLGEIHVKGAEDDAAAQKATKASKRATKKGIARTPARTEPQKGTARCSSRSQSNRNSRRGKNVIEESEEDESDLDDLLLTDDEGDNAENVDPTPRQNTSGGTKTASRRSGSSRPQRLAVQNTNDDGDSDDADFLI